MVKQKIKKYTKQAVFGMSLLSLILTTGCLENPDTEYVSNKEGLGNLITNNIAADNDILIRQQINAPEQVSWDCETAKSEVGIHAAVIVPEVTAVPIWQLQQMEMNSERLEFYAQTIFEDKKIRNSGIHTKKSLEHRVDYLTEFLNAGCLSDGTPLDEVIYEMDSGSRTASDDIRDTIQSLYEEYEDCPEEPAYGEDVDYSFHMEEGSIGYSETSLLFSYDWEYNTVTGIYNGKEYDLTLETDGMNGAICFQLDEYEETAYGYDYRCIKYQKNSTNPFTDREVESTCTISQEEAVKLCRDFLTQLGMENMEAEEIEELDLWEEGQDGIPESNYLGNKGYLLLFHRGYNSIQDISFNLSTDEILNQENSVHWTAYEQFREEYPYEEAAGKDLQGEEGFIVKAVPELAAFIVTDDGISYAWIQNPMEEEKCLAENVMLIEFDQVEKQAEAHFETLYTDTETDKKYTATFIELNYAAMESPNQQGEYILVPVWDFRHGNKVLVSINAIDGTVFDREQGY